MIYLNKNEKNKIIEMLKDGKLLAFPTETVYGLGILSTKEEYFKRLVEVKNRAIDKPFTLMIGDVKEVSDIVELNETTLKIIKEFTPGPLTLILKVKKDIPSYLDLSTGFVGIRIPGDEFLLDVLKKVNIPLLVPSANPSNLKPAMTSEEVYDYFNEKIDGIVVGNIKSNIPSTIIKIDENKLTLIREGELKLKEIEEKLYENSSR